MRKIRNTGVAIEVTGRLDVLVERFRDVPGLVALYLYGSYGTPCQTPLIQHVRDRLRRLREIQKRGKFTQEGGRADPGRVRVLRS